MTFKQYKWTAMIMSFLLIVACSSSRQANHLNGAQSGQVETAGLGAPPRFPGTNAGMLNPQTGEKYNTVYFKFDSNIIENQYMALIRANADYLKAHSSAKLRLEGNTDPRGSREYNIGLGQRRGNAVADALEVMGISRSQLIVVSYGKEKLAVSGDTEADYRLDRRVEMIYESR